MRNPWKGWKRGRDPMPCIKCEKPLDGVSDDRNHPMKGTEFTTWGHYGSRITDTMGSSQHLINLCDDCCEAGKKNGLVFELEHDQRRDRELMGR